MRKLTKHASLHEALRNLWKIRIMLEKSYTETCATWMARQVTLGKAFACRKGQTNA